jgi:hypothetical protein
VWWLTPVTPDTREEEIKRIEAKVRLPSQQQKERERERTGKEKKR